MDETTQPDNPPAFPHSWKQNAEDGHTIEFFQGGMSLRDYFAAKALQGMLCHQEAFQHEGKAAAWAYELADAMLKARAGASGDER